MSLAESILQDLKTRVNRSVVDASVKACEEMDEIKNVATREFRSPAINGIWHPSYNTNYAKRQGKKLNEVNLRANLPEFTNSIEKTNIIRNEDSASIVFEDPEKAMIFAWHHNGEAPGNKIRQIYPITALEVPEEVTRAGFKELTKHICKH